MATQHPQLIAIASARPDGSTTLALGLAGLLSRTERTLLVDLNLERAEIAPLLDIDESRTVFHLAYNAQLSPVTQQELEDNVVWREGLAVLPGVADPAQAEQVRSHFVTGLIGAAQAGFKHVVCDIGRIRPDLPAAAVADLFLWVVAPTPLGIWAFDRAFRHAREAEAPWLGQVQVVVNQQAPDALDGVSGYLSREYRLHVLGDLSYEPNFWRRQQLSHSLRALNVEIRDPARYQRAYGPEALGTREALERLVAASMSEAAPQAINRVEA
jgi:Mrp family chromosome partitioning ATPase